MDAIWKGYITIGLGHMDAIWKGYITFGLVSIPVGLYSAVEDAERVSFRLLHKKVHAPIKYKKFCSAEDVEVPNDEIVKGYEVEKNRFVVVGKEELQEVQEKVGDGDRAIEILKCVQLSSISPLLFERPYYLAPEKQGVKAYTVLRDGLIQAKRVGIARFHLRAKPLLAVLLPGQPALSLAVLRPFEELRDPKELTIPEAQAKAAEVKMAQMLIDQMADEWDPTEHPDEYRRALESLLASKKKGKAFALEEAKRPEKVVDLTEALRRSVGLSGGRKKAAPKRDRAA